MSDTHKKRAEQWAARARATVEIVEATVAIHQLETGHGLWTFQRRVQIDAPLMEKLYRAVAKYIALTETEDVPLPSAPEPGDFLEFEDWCQKFNVNGEVKQLFLYWLYRIKEAHGEVAFTRYTYSQLYSLFTQEVAKAAGESLYRLGVTHDVVKNFL